MVQYEISTHDQIFQRTIIIILLGVTMFNQSIEAHQKIWDTYFTFKDNHLKLNQMPSKLSKKYSVLIKIWMSFPKGFKGSEKEVNAILEPIYEDYVTIRRYLVDYQFLIRDDYGKKYVLNEDLNVLK